MEESAVIGISLGASTVSVGVYEHGVVDILPLDGGNLKMAPVVAFTPNSTLVGQEAQRYMLNKEENQRNTVCDVVRMLGRKYEDELVQKLMLDWPFEVENDAGEIKIKIPNKPGLISPEDVCAIIFQKIVDSVRARRRFEGKAVVAVPAYFNSPQIAAVRRAGEKADIKICSIIDQRFAVDVGYHLRTYYEGDIAFVHVGGATTSVTVIDNSDCSFKVIKEMVDLDLGGNTIDEQLLQFFVNDFNNKYDLDMSNSSLAMARLRASCKKAKCSLTKSKMSYIELHNLYEAIDYSATLTRKKFKELCATSFDKIINRVNEMLESAGCDLGSDESIAILLGGSTKSPKILKGIKRVLKDKVKGEVDPCQAVTWGTVLHAATQGSGTQCLVDSRGLHLSIGVETPTGDLDIILKKGEKVPLRKEKVIANAGDENNMPALCLYEGETSMDKNLLGEFNLGYNPIGSEFKLKVEVDAYGMLEVTSACMTSGKWVKATKIRGRDKDKNEIVMDCMMKSLHVDGNK